MGKVRLVAGLIVFVFALSSSAESPKPNVMKVFESFKYGNNYSGICRVATFKADKLKGKNEYRMLVKGNDSTLLTVRLPSRKKGEKILIVRKKIWYYFPKVDKSIIINYTMPLIGNVNIGDILGYSVLELYKYESHSIDKSGITTISLLANSKEASYGKVVYQFADKKVKRLDIYTRSGVQLKRVYFYEYVNNKKGHFYPTKIKIENAHNPAYYSLIQIKDLSETEDIPQYLFNPANLSNDYSH